MSSLSFDDCKRLGFSIVGDFYSVGCNLDFNLEEFSKENGCYLFLVDEEICYVGETQNGIRHRMRQYRKPGPSQKTNQYVKRMMLEILSGKETVSIAFIPDKRIAALSMSLISIGDVQVHADSKLLERFLISRLKPRWNRS